MNPTEFILAFILAMSIPSGITGFCFWLLEEKMKKKEKEREKKEAVREKQELLIVKSIGAAISLCFTDTVTAPPSSVYFTALSRRL